MAGMNDATPMTLPASAEEGEERGGGARLRSAHTVYGVGCMRYAPPLLCPSCRVVLGGRFLFFSLSVVQAADASAACLLPPASCPLHGDIHLRG
jgi:hypothetical protein